MNTPGARASLAVVMAAVVLLVASCTAPASVDPSSDPAPNSDPAPSSDEGGTGIANEIPATFPDDVPLIDGEVAAGIDVGTGWSGVILAADITAAYDEATAALEGAGFTEDYSQTGDDGSFGQYQSPTYTVQVTGADQPDYGPSITYLVVIT